MIDDVTKEFIIEALEGVEQLDQAFVALEQNPADTEILTRIFRGVHTVKGTSGCLGFPHLEHVAHAGENLLSRMRDGSIAVNELRISLLLKLVDAMRSMLAAIEATGSDQDHQDYASLTGALAAAAEIEAAPRPSGVAHGAADPWEPAGAELFDPPSLAAPEAPLAPTPPNADPRQHDSRLADSTVRVDVALLDRVMNLVGELVLARNRLMQCSGLTADPTLVATGQRINLITSELQEGVMKTRMQPIGSSWGKLPRLVRETALSCGKCVRLETEGHSTELDRTLLDAIRDPLTHILRNSIDHGIETPAERERLGKPVEGRLQILAYHEGGQVTVDVIDDGAGIDAARLRQKAVERGILTAAEAARMSDREAVELIFRPAFSTAARVTHVSGRGVGMDVVRTSIDAVGGTVEVITRVGLGTTMRLKLPLTLAIIPALMVRTRENVYAIPQASLIELLRLDEERQKAISDIGGVPVYRLRGQLLPIVHLSRELGDADRGERGVLHVVVLQAEGQRFGLVVDSVADTAEIVVKPLSKMLKGLAVYAGATVMGDGSVALIIDVPGLAQRAGVLRTGVQAAAAAEAAAARSNGSGIPREQLLVVTDGLGRPYAVPLASVSRLEEFPATMLESAAGSPAVNYRDEIMPVVSLGTLVGSGSDELGGSSIRVIVYRSPGGSVAIAVNRIEDILHVELKLASRTARPGVRGAAVVSGRVTDVLDLGALLQTRVPELLAEWAA